MADHKGNRGMRGYGLVITILLAGLVGCAVPVQMQNIPQETQKEEPVGLANPWEYDVSPEEVKELTGGEFIVPEEASDIVYGVMKEAKLAEMNFTLGDVRYCARMEPADDFEDIAGLFYEWDAEGVEDMGGAEALVRINLEENVTNVLWYDGSMMRSMYTNGADSEGYEVVRMARIVFDVPEASDGTDHDTMEINIGTTGFVISIPSDYYEGKVTREDRSDDQIAYYKSDGHLMDFDVYQFDKEGKELPEYAESEAKEYGAENVEEVTYNGIRMMLYYSTEEYDGNTYRVANYIFENDTDFAELSFWLDGDDAEDLVEQILFSIYAGIEGSDDGTMHAMTP